MAERSQYQATRLLDAICDLRVSISTGDYIERDRWGRASSGRVPRFLSRAAAASGLAGLSERAARPRLPAPPTHPALPAPPLPPTTAAEPAAQLYAQPPAPPAHVVVAGDATPTRDPSFRSERASEPPSFGNLRDLSSATSRPRSPPPPVPAARRPRGAAAAAALADILELNDEAVVKHVFDDSDEPMSATGAVASVPQGPRARGAGALALAPLPPPPPPPPAPGTSTEGRQEGERGQGAEEEEEEEEEEALVPLRSDIPDRPRVAAWGDDDLYFSDVGDVAPADDGGPAERGSVRPQLREQMFAIKSYHHRNLSFDEEDDDDFADDESESTVNSSNTDRSASALYLRKRALVLPADEAFEVSDVSRSFDTATTSAPSSSAASSAAATAAAAAAAAAAAPAPPAQSARARLRPVALA